MSELLLGEQLLARLLRSAREYVSDSLAAHEHSDGRTLLREIDAALIQPLNRKVMGKLNPCPLCAGEAMAQENHWRDGNLRGGEPFCKKCGLKMPRHWPRREADAITAWNTRPLTQPSELVELVGCISKTAWLLRLNLEDGDKRMAIENSNTMLSLIERGTAPDDLPSARTLHAEIAACITRQEGFGGDSLVCSLGSYLATRITQLEAQLAKLQADGDRLARKSLDALKDAL